MNRRIIILTTVLLLLGLLGIATVQVFWLQKAIQYSEQNFDKNIFQALYDVSTEIDNLKVSPLISEAMGAKDINSKIKGDIIMRTTTR